MAGRADARKTAKAREITTTPSRTARESVGRPKPLVGIVYGSSSDEPVLAECAAVLDRFGIPSERVLLSAHRMPESTAAYARDARRRGLRVLIAGAGMAAHLPGVLASLTTLPVIGVPLCGSALEGLDALYSMVQMPAGVPVATVAIGKAGAKNAAVLAAEILALSDAALARRLDDLKHRLESGQKL